MCLQLIILANHSRDRSPPYRTLCVESFASLLSFTESTIFKYPDSDARFLGNVRVSIDPWDRDAHTGRSREDDQGTVRPSTFRQDELLDLASVLV